MKQQKLLFSLMAAIAILSSGILSHISFSHSEKDYSILFMSNIEALSDEYEATKPYEYPDGYPFHSTCQTVVGKGFLKTIRCKNPITECQGGGGGCNTVDCPQHPRFK